MSSLDTETRKSDKIKTLIQKISSDDLDTTTPKAVSNSALTWKPLKAQPQKQIVPLTSCALFSGAALRGEQRA